MTARPVRAACVSSCFFVLDEDLVVVRRVFILARSILRIETPALEVPPKKCAISQGGNALFSDQSPLLTGP
jgi:hypothetical protein